MKGNGKIVLTAAVAALVIFARLGSQPMNHRKPYHKPVSLGAGLPSSCRALYAGRYGRPQSDRRSGKAVGAKDRGSENAWRCGDRRLGLEDASWELTGAAQHPRLLRPATGNSSPDLFDLDARLLE
jgi:hypothetical protein